MRNKERRRGEIEKEDEETKREREIEKEDEKKERKKRWWKQAGRVMKF